MGLGSFAKLLIETGKLIRSNPALSEQDLYSLMREINSAFNQTLNITEEIQPDSGDQVGVRPNF